MKNKYLWLLILLSVFQIAKSQTLKNRVPNLQTSWIGNSFAGGTKWVQNNMEQVQVAPDGTIHTWSSWDEGGRPFGVYKGFQREDGTWYGDVIGNDNISFNGGQATIGKTQWYIEGYVNLNGYDTGRSQRQGTKVKCSGTNIVLNFSKATSLGVDYKNNYLMVTDDGPQKHLVMCYDTLGNFVKQIGIPGGIWPSAVGGNKALDGVIDNDLKFYFLSGCGADSTGNIYVTMTDIYQMSGSWIRCFNPKGDSLLWEIHSHYFTDASDFDHTKDGKELFSCMRHYEIDYTKAPGKQYTLKGISINPNKFPSDPRMGSRLKVPLVRYIEGKKFLFYTGMSSNGFDIFKFDSINYGETAIYTGIKLNTSNYQSSSIIDSIGNFWYTNDNSICKIPVNGIDANNNPKYGSLQTFAKPDLFANIKNCWYAGGKNDVMYIGGFKPGDNDITGWFEVGRVMARYDNWHTSPKLVWQNDALPFYHHNALPVGGRIVNKTIFTAGDYVFIDYVTYNTVNPERAAPGVMNVYNVSDGKFVGEIFAGEEVFNQSSWHDVNVAFNVMKRSNNEYVITGEENWKAKSLLYRWCPTGDCENFTYSTISVNTTKKYAIKEGQVAGEILFKRKGLVNDTLSVNYTLSGNSTSADFTTKLTGKITFAAGKDTARLILKPSVNGDFSNKKLVITLKGNNNYWLHRDSIVASVFLFGHPKTKVTIFALSDTIQKNGLESAAIVVKRDNSSGSLPINLLLSGTAKSDLDFLPVNTKLILPAGTSELTFFVKSKTDIVLKDTKYLVITIPNDTSYLVTNNSFVSVTIKGDRPLNTDSVGTITCFNSHDTITVDGEFKESCWQFKNELAKETDGWKRNSAYFAMNWDTTYLYLGVIVKDAKIVVTEAGKVWENDGIEIYIDGDNHKGSTLNSSDEQYISNAGDVFPLWSQKGKTANVKRKSKIIDGGYTLEMAIPWKLFGVKLKDGLKVGFDLSCDDNNGSGRDNSFCWNGNGDNFQSVAKYGTIVLKDTIGWNLGTPVDPGTLPVVSITSTNSVSSEEKQETAVVNISRNTTKGALAVNYSISGTASSSDYTSNLKGSVILADGTASATLNITAVKDDLKEGNETIVLNLLSIDTYMIGANSQVIVYLKDSVSQVSQADIPLSGLKVWLRADKDVVSTEGKVSVWMDEAGSDNNAIQNSASAQPLLVNGIANSHPAILFNGTNSSMSFNFPVNGLGNMSLFTVTQDLAGKIDVWGQYSPITWNDAGSWGSVYLAADNKKVAWRFGTSESDNTSIFEYPTPLDASKFVVASSVMNGVDDNISVNGLAVGTKKRIMNVIANTSDACKLGGGANETMYKGYIAEILIYNVSLSNIERAQVEKYLTDKYLIATTSVTQLNSEKPVIYPNPLNGNTLNINNLEGATKVDIFDMFGRLIYQHSENSNGLLQLTNIQLNAGLYVISIANNNRYYVQKLIVK